ncbi:hypothetical protein, partial [Shigella boydii]|uniref:hypothetical protein n=1 Tax=Shigella boydii TaxID=621 RepID=UPI003EBB0801
DALMESTPKKAPRSKFPALLVVALALNSLFHVGESLQISHGVAIWLLVILLGLAGILYAVIGGLRAMA